MMRPRDKDQKKQKPRRQQGNRDLDNRKEASHETETEVVYGVLPVTEALRSNASKIDKIMIADGSSEYRISEIVSLARSANILVEKVKRETLDRVTGGGVNHQGVAAKTSAADYSSLEEILAKAGEEPLLVVLDGVEDPRNLGAVLRGVECAGAHGVIIPERRAVGLTGTVAKSSAGAVEYVKVAKIANINRCIEELKEKNIWVVGTSGDAKIEYTEWDWTQPSALVLGAEGSGLHRLVAENCDVLVKIPMKGKIDSLNVSVAAGVILFEAVRQRKIKGS